MTTPADFDFLTGQNTAASGNGNGAYPPPLPESEIAQLLTFVPHKQMHPALLKLAGHFAAKLGPRLDEILGIILPATRQWEQPVDEEKVCKTVADVVKRERQKRAEREAASPYDEQGYEETVVDVDPETEPASEADTPEASAGKTPKKTAGAILPFEVVPGPDFMKATFTGADRLVPGIGLTECGVGVLSGAGGHGKSVLAGNVALGWTLDATTLPELLRPVRTLRVMVFMVEDAPDMVQERLKAMLGPRPAPPGLLLFTRKEPMQFGGSKGRPLLKALDRLAVTLARHQPIDVVLFDPLVYLHQAEENSSSEMMRWLVPFREVCRQAGAAVVIVHHAGWAPDGEDARGRGSTAIRAWADFELSLRKQDRNGKKLYRLNLVKCNFARQWADALTMELAEATLRFGVVDEAEILCSTSALIPWMLDDLNGTWTKPRLDFYAAVCARFNCSDRTARTATASAIREKKLTDHGRGKPLEVVASRKATLL